MQLLYITWDGPDQRYLESLYLPIFAGLSGEGIHTHVLQFRWGDDAGRAAAARSAHAVGVGYEARQVDRGHILAGTAGTLVRGVRDVSEVARRVSADVIMPRSILPGAMALGASFRGSPRPGLVFDADGLMADERVDFAGWSPRGLPYRTLRSIESALVRRSDAVLTRTAQARSILLERAGRGGDAGRVHVVPNSRDEELCHPGDEESRRTMRSELGIPADAPLVVYCGTLGPQYMPERIFRFLLAVRRRRPDARLLVLTGNEEAARDAARSVGVEASAVHILRAPPEEVPGHLAAADLGIAFRIPSFSQRAVCPIKVGEYLLTGLPVLYSAGIGDLDSRLGPHPELARADSMGSLEDAAAWFCDDLLPRREVAREGARALGLREYALKGTVSRMADVLREVAQSRS